ncbi:MAG TPA: sigma-70 family RNA polymerase sigma factor [Dehalococcoidia bacterium]
MVERPNTETEAEVDEAILVAAARSDPEQFGALYDRYVTPIYRYCHVRLGNREEAEDATSEVFLRALAGLHAYRGGNFAAWIYRIAHNSVVDRQRRRRSHVPLEVVDATISDKRPPDQRAIELAEQQRLRQHVAALLDDQRAAIELRLAGWQDLRIAAALGKSVAAVKKLRFRAVRRLRKALLPGTDTERRAQ